MKNSLTKKPPILIGQIETLEGIDNIDEILSLNVLNYIMIGPYDLSASLGIPGEFNNKIYLDCVNKIKTKVKEDKMAVHIPNNVQKEIKKYKNYGIIAIGMDTTFLLEKYLEAEKYA